MMKWIAYRKQGKLPPERRSVLLSVAAAEVEYDADGRITYAGHAAIVAVGYLRIHSAGPFWVIPGVPHRDEEVVSWCDCLGDDFTAPVWRAKQVVGETKRRWFHPEGWGLIYPGIGIWRAKGAPPHA